jgi:hypothetical protein
VIVPGRNARAGSAAGADAGADAHADNDADADGDAHGDAHGDAGAHAHGDAAGDAARDAGADPQADADGNADGNAAGDDSIVAGTSRLACVSASRVAPASPPRRTMRRSRPNHRATCAARSLRMRIVPPLAIAGGHVICSPTVTPRCRCGRRGR